MPHATEGSGRMFRRARPSRSFASLRDTGSFWSMDGSLSPLIPLFAISFAMIAFALVVILGGSILRRLRIESEPPDVYRFQPPTPTIEQGHINGSSAPDRAERRRALLPVYQQAQATYTAWAQIIDGLYTIEAALGLSSQHGAEQDIRQVQEQVHGWRAQCERIKTELEELLPSIPDQPSVAEAIDKLHTDMKQLYDDVETLWLAQGHDTAPRKRLVMLVLLFVIVVIWAFIMFGLPSV